MNTSVAEAIACGPQIVTSQCPGPRFLSIMQRILTVCSTTMGTSEPWNAGVEPSSTCPDAKPNERRAATLAAGEVDVDVEAKAVRARGRRDASGERIVGGED